jgi:hypothetical protein
MPEGIDWRIAEAQDSCIAGVEAVVHLLLQNPNQLAEPCFVSLTGLLHAAHHAGRNLITGWRECDVPLLGWAARNSLEVSIWIKYITLSESNAERFYHDWLNDAEEALRRAVQLDQLSGKYEKLDSVYADMAFDASAPANGTAHIAALRREHQFSAQRRLDISKIAKEIGDDDLFSNLNPILSKHIHTTAYSVLSFPTDASRRSTALMFLDQGFWSLAKTIGIVDIFLKARNLQSLFTP